MLRFLAVLAGLFTAAGVFADSPPLPGAASAGRWYSPEQAQRGALVYTQHCVECHGKNGEGTQNWRKRGSDGKFPPPPINGAGHAWHHPITILSAQIKYGAPGGKGSMPGFADKLSDQQVMDVIAWIQDWWSDGIYATWAEIQARASN